MRIAFLSIVSLALFAQSASAQCSSGSCSVQSLASPWRPPPFQWSQAPAHDNGFYVTVRVGESPPVYAGYTRVQVNTRVNVRVFQRQGGLFGNLFRFRGVGSCQ